MDLGSSFRRVWRYVRWPLLVLVVMYVGLVAYRVPAMFEADKTKEAVTEIHAARLTLADAKGENLPPAPDEAENNATLTGVDQNKTAFAMMWSWLFLPHTRAT